MTLGKRISELRKEKDLTQNGLAEELGITRSSLSLYELDSREPDYDLLKKMADYFGCSTDYLLGKTPTRKWDTEGLAFSAQDIDGLTDEDIAAVKLIIEGLKAKHQAKKK